jgi:hypothetical protein
MEKLQLGSVQTHRAGVNRGWAETLPMIVNFGLNQFDFERRL